MDGLKELLTSSRPRRPLQRVPVSLRETALLAPTEGLEPSNYPVNSRALYQLSYVGVLDI